MDISLSGRCPDHTVVAVRGDIDLATAGDLLTSLREILHTRGRGIGLDLSGVTFIDCAGLRTLLALTQCAADAGCTMCLAARSPSVAWLLELIDLPPESCYLAQPAEASATCAAGAPGSSGVCTVRRRVSASSNHSRPVCVALTVPAADSSLTSARPGP